MRKKCPFCHIETQGNRLLYKTKSFYILCDMGPLVEGHLLIIPKQHLMCFGQLSEQKYDELKHLLKDIEDFLMTSYKKSLILFENGGVSQTVSHAHLHIFPSTISIKKELKKELGGRKLLKTSKIRKIRDFYKEFGCYLFYQEKATGLIFEGASVASGFLRRKCAQALGVAETFVERVEFGNPFAKKVKEKWGNWRKL